MDRMGEGVQGTPAAANRLGVRLAPSRGGKAATGPTSECSALVLCYLL